MSEKNSFQLKLITPQGTVLTEEIILAVVPSGIGPIGILPGHVPLLGIVVSGILRAQDKAKKEFLLYVGKGFFMISREGVTIVAQTAERTDKIDVARATAAKERAKQSLVSGDKSIDRERVNEALQRADMRIKAAEKANGQSRRGDNSVNS